MGRFWLGSVADEMVRKLPMPLLLVRPDEAAARFEPEPTPRHILIALDGEPLAEQVLERAMEMGTLTGASYTLLRVIKPVLPTPYTAEGASMAQMAQSLIEETERIQEQIRKEALAYLERVAGEFCKHDMKVAVRVEVEDSPALAILKLAPSADVVALSTHGRHGLSRLFLGSVTDKVIRGGHVPVLVYRPMEEKK
jgi:nucleotide-binding universal stress UspA family protein